MGSVLFGLICAVALVKNPVRELKKLNKKMKIKNVILFKLQFILSF